MIEFRHVSKVFGSGEKKIEALKNVNLTVREGDIFGVIGFSGAGKSTLIRTVNLLEQPTSGEVIVDGKNLAKLPERQLREAKKRIGMIFQHFNLLQSKTVFDNVAMPLVLSKKKKKAIEERVYEVLRFVGLEEKARNYPDQLSGGQKQRVGIARALVTNPSILLCDEATSALDPQTTQSILKLLKRVNEEFKITILIITHEMEVIKQICNRVAVMEDGCVIESGTMFELFSRPQTETAKNFVRSVVRDEIPVGIHPFLQATEHHSRFFKLAFFGAASGQSVISRTAKVFDVDIHILYGNITELQGIPIGHLMVGLTGDDDEIERALIFITGQNVEVKEVLEDGSQHKVDFERFVGNVVHG